MATGHDFDAYARVRAVWLWAPRGAVLAGAAAALIHGEHQASSPEVLRAVDLYVPRHTRSPRGIRIHRLPQPLSESDIVDKHGMRCTSVSRTALDLARWQHDPLKATMAVDAVCNITNTPVSEVQTYARTTKGLHDYQRAMGLLEHCDYRAGSPRETWLRLIIEDSPLPMPDLQVEISDSASSHIVTADLAYREEKVALHYDGEHHLDREQRDWDSNVTARLFDEGWLDLRITAGMLRDPQTLLRRIAEMLRRQGRTDV